MPKSWAAKARIAEAKAAWVGQPAKPPQNQSVLEDHGFGPWGAPPPWAAQIQQ